MPNELTNFYEIWIKVYTTHNQGPSFTNEEAAFDFKMVTAIVYCSN